METNFSTGLIHGFVATDAQINMGMISSKYVNIASSTCYDALVRLRPSPFVFGQASVHPYKDVSIIKL